MLLHWNVLSYILWTEHQAMGTSMVSAAEAAEALALKEYSAEVNRRGACKISMVTVAFAWMNAAMEETGQARRIS